MPTQTRDAVDTAPAELLTDEVKSQLQEAIKTVSEKQLREFVAELARKEPAAERELVKMLLVPRSKRKRADEVQSRWMACANCRVEYDVGEDRKAGECQYHPGELEPDYEAFVDDDYDETTIESEELMQEFPENYNWTCCGEDGTVEGCIAGKHVHGGESKKRKR
ncbi:hypothetical protein DACRYDRAFT_58119 [Dacryopinax primogenitus]|uniref:C2H2-type domain-containing protein n=1 Tax=Dacryopinax primogenitus (strain DJM 731) TaxID=1858805 RepID=M5G392_DACPD|nr:uncharacterized protein DACRYDRAFT_58119 [Dacryopinax primogenitus]EJT98217.1 hypothetical protein DACRYDRAFT_58119 [Dacryopinax primogenitus]